MSLVNVKCPNCGASIQLDDSRAEGFCSYCGSKVKLEEAKKLTIQGTVKVDSSDELANLYQIAEMPPGRSCRFVRCNAAQRPVYFAGSSGVA